MNLVSLSTYQKVYLKYMERTKENKDGFCFGLCLEWLESYIISLKSGRSTLRILRLIVNNDFFLNALKKQASHEDLLTKGGKLEVFLKQMEDKYDDEDYPINYAIVKYPQLKPTLNNLLKNCLKEEVYGIIFAIETQGVLRGLHAVTLLKHGNRKYLFDPNTGVHELGELSIDALLNKLNAQTYNSIDKDGCGNLRLGFFISALVLT